MTRNGLLLSGREVLLSLIYPKTEREMTPAQREEFDLAAEEEEAYLASPAGRSAIASADGRIERESVGDVSVTYRGGASGSVTAAGLPVAPAASARLLRCGLAGRWV